MHGRRFGTRGARRVSRPGRRVLRGPSLLGLTAPMHTGGKATRRNGLFVPAGIRHIFAHGDLTPHAGGVNPYVAQEMANLLSEFIFKVMDGEFTRRLREHGVAA